MQCASNKVESNLRTHAQKVKKRGAEKIFLDMTMCCFTDSTGISEQLATSTSGYNPS